MRDRKIWYTLERHAGHTLVVREREKAGEGPSMQLACQNCKTIVLDIPAPRSMRRARSERERPIDDAPVPAPRATRTTRARREYSDDYFDEA